MKITEIDSNFAVPEVLKDAEYDWYDPRDGIFEFYGLLDPTDKSTPYHRIPFEVASSLNEGIETLNRCTSGGRIRFSTDSDTLAIIAETYIPISVKNAMPLSGANGFDLYRNRPDGTTEFVCAHFPAPEAVGEMGYSCVRKWRSSGMRNYTLDFPLYGSLRNVWIGLAPGSKVSGGVKYANEKPFVFYGSSITQGACASRPGRCYEALLSRRLNLNYYNLGFSGRAKGEPEIIDYMSGLPMSAFICDYDHNAPTREHLEATLPLVYSGIREKNPDLPFVFVSRPTRDVLRRRDCVIKNYKAALDAGDKNVWFIDGLTFFPGSDPDDFTIEGCHPNDAGYARMADVFEPTLRRILDNLTEKNN